MTGAMYSAIAGLKTHMSKLNVIGNNVANANTYGYKAARTTFQESLYSSVRSGSNGSASMGGVNPSQMGYGCSIGTIDLDMGTQSYVPTGRGMDCMINGDGFFMVGPKPDAAVNGNNYTLGRTEPDGLLLTRVGNFKIDADGYLTDGNGNVVYGFATRSGTAAAPGTTPGIADKNDPQVSTQLVPIRLPLAANGDDPDIPAGTAIFPGVDGDGNNIYDAGIAGSMTTGKTITTNTEAITIDGNTGQISCSDEINGGTMVIGYIPLAKVTNINGVTHIQGSYFQAAEGAGDCTVASVGDVMNGKFLNNAADGTTGQLQIFSAGEQVSLIGNGLEASGTDIATEFSEMISTQRGYQANTRIVTVTDAMLEELVNMKR